MKKETARIKGFLRGQLVDADSGWTENTVLNYGLTALAAFAAGAAGSVKPGRALLAAQVGAMTMSQTALVSTGNAYAVFGATGTSGTGAASFTCSFAGSDGSLAVGAAGLYTSNSAGGLWAGQTFATSNMATNQNFNLTYQFQFATA
jgi:hypothetical protein